MQRIFEKLRNNKVFRIMAKPVLCMMLAAGLLFSSLSMTVQAEDVLDTTWYTLSSAASGWLSDTLAKGNDVSGIPGGSVGGVLGYCDEANTSGVIIDLIQSTVSSSSATYSYDALSNMGNVEFVNYGNYGRALRSIGLDGTGTSSPNAIRAVAGNLLLGLYNVSTFVNHIFSFVVDFLRKINPYRLFTFKGGNMVNFTGDGIEKMTMSDRQTMAGYMNNLLAFLRDNFAWLIIIPASVTFLIWALFLSNRNKGYEIKKFIWRIAIIFFSVPIMGGIYTSTLDWIDDEIDPKNGTPSAKIVASMLVDFESWAQSGLAVDGGIVIHNINTSDMGATQDANVSSIRNICLTINNKACPSLPTAISGNADNAGSWNSTISGNTDNADINSVDVSSFIRSLCVRYASGDKYTPSDYRGWWTSTHATPFEGQPIEQTVKDTDTLLDWTSNNASAYLSSDPAGLWSGADKPWTGMSPMSVYNYLSTEFSDSGIIIYSNEKASSGFIRDFHYSVNLVGGNGLVSVLVFINGATMLVTPAAS